MEEFRVTTFDLLGQAGSGRPPFLAKNAPECIDFFQMSLDAWVTATNYDSEKFYILGHNFGGYIAAEYALKRP